MTRDVVDVALAENVIRFHPVVSRERDTALQDLLEQNSFTPVSGLPGPFRLDLRIEDDRLAIDVTSQPTKEQETIRLPVRPLRSVIRDYFEICASYYRALTEHAPARLEAVDMGRRGVHDEGARQLRDALAPRVVLDDDTARRLFTLVCVLHIRNPGQVMG